MTDQTFPRRLGRYRLLRRIGKGSMATVYRAVLLGPHGFENEVAIKLVHPELLAAYPKVIKMAVDEARIAARLHHPNIVRILDLVEEEGCFYMVMDYVDGVSMRVVLDAARETGSLPPLGPVLEVLAAACDGLYAAHGLCRADGTQLNLVHRDVKPDNIMVSTDGEVKVGDFGIATFVDRMADATAQGQLKGTPAYMAPEQTLGGPLDSRTDLFSMGLTLYTLSTTELAFRAKKPVGVALKIARESLEPHADRLDSLLPGLGDVLRTACARDPDKRFSDAAAMAEALREVYTTITQPRTIADMLATTQQVVADVVPGDVSATDMVPHPTGPMYSAPGDEVSAAARTPPEAEGPGEGGRAVELATAPDENQESRAGPSLSVGVRPDAPETSGQDIEGWDHANGDLLDAQVTDPTDRFLPDAEATDPPNQHPLGAEAANPPRQEPPGPGPAPSAPDLDGRRKAPSPPAPSPPQQNVQPQARPTPTAAGPSSPASPAARAPHPGSALLAPPRPQGRPTAATATSLQPGATAMAPRTPQNLPERDYRGRVVRRARSPESTHVGQKEKVGVAAAVAGLGLIVALLVLSLWATPDNKPDTDLPLQTPTELGLGQETKKGPRPNEELPQQPRSRFLTEQKPEGNDKSAGNAAGPTETPATRKKTGSTNEKATVEATQASAQKTAPPSRARQPRTSSGAQPRAASGRPAAQPVEDETPTADQEAGSTTGTITINSYPWSRIYIDGADIGRTPMQAHPLDVGVHTIELVFPTADNKRFSKRVEVRPDRNVRVVHRLPAEGSE